MERELCTRVAIEPHDGLDSLKISVMYSRGGFNPFSCEREPRGVYAVLTPVETIDGGACAFRPGLDTRTSGFKVLVTPLERRSRREEERVWNALEGRAGEIASLFSDSRFGEAADVINGVSRKNA